MMPDKLSADELGMEQGTGSTVPVWAPNPGVPIMARILAYTFGGLMLLTFIANCMTKPAADIPKFPKAWEVLQLPGCGVPYPQGWHLSPQEVQQGSAILSHHLVTLLPAQVSPVRVEVIAQEIPTNMMPSTVVHLLNEGVRQNLVARQYEHFSVEQDGGSYTDVGAAFTYLQGQTEITGEWMILTNDKYAVIFIGFAATEGWPAMQVILREMAAQIKWSS